MEDPLSPALAPIAELASGASPDAPSSTAPDIPVLTPATATAGEETPAAEALRGGSASAETPVPAEIALAAEPGAEPGLVLGETPAAELPATAAVPAPTEGPVPTGATAPAEEAAPSKPTTSGAHVPTLALAREPAPDPSAAQAAPAPAPIATPTPGPSITAANVSATSPPAATSPEPHTWFKEVLWRLKQQQRQQTKDVSPPKDMENENVKPKGKAKAKTADVPPSPSPVATQKQDRVAPADPTTGMSPTAKDLYEGQPKCRCCINWVECPPKDTKINEFMAKENARHAILLRHRREHDSSRPPYVLHSIRVQSPMLRESLSEVLKDYPGVSTEVEELIFEAPFRCLFYRLGELEAVREGLATYELEEGAGAVAGSQEATDGAKTEDIPRKGDKQKAAEHVGLLYGVVSDELKHTSQMHADLTSKGVISFEHLWTLFPPGSLVFARFGPVDDEQILKVEGEIVFDEKKRLTIPCSYVEFDGEQFGWAATSFKIAPFAGTKKIDELTVVPIEFCSGREELEKKLLKRGKKWEQLAGVSCRDYQGRATCPDETRAVLGLAPTAVIDGRIMVDAEAYRDAVWWEPPVKVKPLSSGSVERRPLADEELILCSAAVRGYSLGLKQWAVFTVDSIQDIEWSTCPLDKLVVSPATKDTILTLVDTHLKGTSRFTDFVAGKGQGISFLLSGPPGVGKTLTAELVAEHFQAPLFSLSAGDLSRDTRRTEKKLGEVFRHVARWNAVLLLEDAEAFLTERKPDGTPKANHFVSVFLQMLEYHHKGIVFLTSNKVDTMDPAAESRINATFEYPELSCEARELLWNKFIASRSSITVQVSDEEREELVQMPMNGRQVRNVVKVGVLLASGKGEPLKFEHLKKAADMVCARSRARAAAVAATAAEETPEETPEEAQEPEKEPEKEMEKEKEPEKEPQKEKEPEKEKESEKEPQKEPETEGEAEGKTEKQAEVPTPDAEASAQDTKASAQDAQNPAQETEAPSQDAETSAQGANGSAKGTQTPSLGPPRTPTQGNIVTRPRTGSMFSDFFNKESISPDRVSVGPSCASTLELKTTDEDDKGKGLWRRRFSRRIKTGL